MTIEQKALLVWSQSWENLLFATFKKLGGYRAADQIFVFTNRQYNPAYLPKSEISSL